MSHPPFVATGDGRLKACPACGLRCTLAVDEATIKNKCQPGPFRVPAKRGPCVHRGEESRREECDTCRGRVKLKVFDCTLHGECTLEKPLVGVATCNDCADYQPPPSSALLRFRHGLGDHVQFSVALQHLRELRPDLTLDVECGRLKARLLEGLCRRAFAGGAEPAAQRYDNRHDIAWREPRQIFADSPSTKAEHYLRDNGIQPRLDLCRYRVAVADETRARARAWYAAQGLRQAAGRFPVALIHNDGITAAKRKNVPDDALHGLAGRLLALGITPIVLGWHGRSAIGNLSGVLWPQRRDPLWDGQSHGDPTLIAALAEQASLCVGVDSGPGHIFGATDTPTIISWLGHHPLNYYGLSPNVLHLLPEDHERNTRGDFAQARDFFPAHYRHRTYADLSVQLPDAAEALLGPRRFLDCPAADVQLGHWIDERCHSSQSHGYIHDRPRSLAALFAEVRRRFAKPLIVETGCIREWDDWAGAGYFTYLAGFYAQQTGGRLDSVDLDGRHVSFARERCRWFPVNVHQADSVGWLRTQLRPIDVLYLDSLDTYEPGHAEHCLAEVQAALPLLQERSIIVVDDCPRVGGLLTGKGSLAVPWLLARGWRLLFDGYQQVLVQG